MVTNTRDDRICVPHFEHRCEIMRGLQIELCGPQRLQLCIATMRNKYPGDAESSWATKSTSDSATHFPTFARRQSENRGLGEQNRSSLPHNYVRLRSVSCEFDSIVTSPVGLLKYYSIANNILLWMMLIIVIIYHLIMIVILNFPIVKS